MSTDEISRPTPQAIETMRGMAQWLRKMDRLLASGKPGAKQARQMVRNSLTAIDLQLKRTAAPDLSEAAAHRPFSELTPL